MIELFMIKSNGVFTGELSLSKLTKKILNSVDIHFINYQEQKNIISYDKDCEIYKNMTHTNDGRIVVNRFNTLNDLKNYIRNNSKK